MRANEVGDFRRGEGEFAHADGLGLPALVAKLVDQLEHAAGWLVVAELDRLDHVGLGDLGCADLDHVDAVLVAAEDQVEIAEIELCLRGIDDELGAVSVWTRPTRTVASGPSKGHRDESEGGGRGRAGEHVGVVLAVVAHDEAWIWTSSMKPSGKSGRIGRSIIRIVRISFSFGGAFALAEATGELAGGGGLLTVVDR